MRPIRLEMTAFGPYAGVQTLDFRDLGEKRFFLVHGPTGAGKTSILDAMTYALYGVTTGSSERTGAEMRSLLSEPGTATEVTFDFAIGAERYRVWRRPEQSRPKQRGDGMTVDKPNAALWRRTDCASDADEGIPLATGVRDVDAAVEDLLGFSCDQFRQVVVLPQGRFRELLSADVKQREEILKQLFKTERFARMTDFLKAKRAELKREIEGATERRAGVLESAGVESREELDTLLASAEEAVAVAAAGLEQATAAAALARETLERGKEAAAAQREAVEAASALELLQSRTADVEVSRAELVAARKAHVVEGAYAIAADRRTALGGAEASLAAALAALPAAQAAFDTACGAAAQAQAAEKDALELERLEARHAEAVRAAQDAQRLAALRASVRAAEDKVETLTRDHERATAAAAAARAEADAVERTWRDGRAVALAATLEEGAPCPVCGSTDHPAPAHGSEDSVDEARLDASRTAAEEARAAVERLAAAVAAAGEAAIAEQERLDSEVARSGEAHVDPDAAADAVRTLGEELEAKRLVLTSAAAAAQECEHAKEHARQALADAKAAAETARTHSDAVRETLAEAEASLSAVLAESGFDDEAAYIAVKRTGIEIDALDAAVTTWDREVAAARDRDARARTAAEVIGPPPELARLEAQNREAERLLAESTRTHAAAERDRARWTDAVASVDRIESDNAERLARYDTIARLAEVADGGNPLKLSFQRFVLGGYLDDVLVHASRKLQRMSGGRYRLERSTDVRHRGRAAGLALSVHDEVAGETRPAGTLSGGEGFLASLALALGLAEAVQAHAGGVKLDTIFIDEGFGTLDPEALDSAIATLLDLAGVAAEQGRLVGVISHVPELRQQIDARLEVSMGEHGSTARFVV